MLASLRDEFEHVAAAGECADFEHDNRAGIARVVGVFDARRRTDSGHNLSRAGKTDPGYEDCSATAIKRDLIPNNRYAVSGITSGGAW